MTPTPAPALSPPRFNPWPYAIIGFFVVAIGCTLAVIYVATSNRSELVAGDYYDQEMRYQERMEQIQRTRVWEPRIAVTLDEVRREVDVRLPVEHAAVGARGQVEFYRPSSAGADRSVPLALDAAGRQRISVADLAAGRWQVRLRWTVGADGFYADRDLVIPALARP